MLTSASLSTPLNRILIGDVGSGKTLVAFITAIAYLYGLDVNLPENKYDNIASLLAPTEVLANQHYHKLLELKTKNNLQWLDCLLLTQKNKILNGQKIPNKSLQEFLLNLNSKKLFCIGTQALFFESKLKPKMVVVDEQHRFGVKQRKNLSNSANTDKAQNEAYIAHFLSMTGTPIPRTLALTIYGTLEPIFLQKLVNRSKIKTSLTTFDKLEQTLIPAIQAILKSQHKAYIVCPKIGKDEDDPEDDLWSVAKIVKFLEPYFPNQILQVTGKQKDKTDILEKFRNQLDKSILVATTVIEVGIDVPQATFVAIFNAERFGLSALHQIRGRVGRNDLENNQCLLVVDNKYKNSKRLNYILNSDDGFEIAQKDLELRGAGEIYGQAQSGFNQEINQLLGLSLAQYNQINQVIDSLDWNTLDLTLPRLKKYLINRQNQIWNE